MLRRQCSTIWVSSTTLLLVVLFAVGLVGLAWAQPQAQQVQEGQAIFQAQCAACHTIGGGPLAGPDLEGVAARRPRDWLVQWIAAPDQVLAGGDPTATQPAVEPCLPVLYISKAAVLPALPVTAPQGCRLWEGGVWDPT
jgi:hypothetical protein